MDYKELIKDLRELTDQDLINPDELIAVVLAGEIRGLKEEIAAQGKGMRTELRAGMEEIRKELAKGPVLRMAVAKPGQVIIP